MTRAGMGISIACAILLAGAPNASALSGAGFMANSASDGQFISHDLGGVYNTDTNSEHWVNANLGIFAPVSGLKTYVTVVGYGLGEFRTCDVYVNSLNGSAGSNGGYGGPPQTGRFTTTFTVRLTSYSQVMISCNLGKATSSQNAYLYDAYVTQAP